MSKHVGICILYKASAVEYTVVILIYCLLVVIKTINDASYIHQNKSMCLFASSVDLLVRAVR